MSKEFGLLTVESLYLRHREKRSQALRGRNLARDIPVDGAPKVRPAPGSIWLLGAFKFQHWQALDTGAIPPKIPPRRNDYCRYP